MPHPFSSLASNDSFQHHSPATTRGRGGQTSSSTGELALLHPATADMPLSSGWNRKHLFYTKRYTISALKIQGIFSPVISSALQCEAKNTPAKFCRTTPKISGVEGLHDQLQRMRRSHPIFNSNLNPGKFLEQSSIRRELQQAEDSCTFYS